MDARLELAVLLVGAFGIGAGAGFAAVVGELLGWW